MQNILKKKKIDKMKTNFKITSGIIVWLILTFLIFIIPELARTAFVRGIYSAILSGLIILVFMEE